MVDGNHGKHLAIGNDGRSFLSGIDLTETYSCAFVTYKLLPKDIL